MSDYIVARGDGSNVVFIENASGAVNAVIRSLSTQPGDIIIQFSIAYGMVKETVKYVEQTGDLHVITIPVFFHGDATMPTSTGGVDLVKALSSVMSDLDASKVKLVLLDHISSLPAVILPVEDLAAVAKAKGVPVFVDGAHALGAIPVNMTSLEESGVSFWVGNGHKWLYSPKGSALLWVAPKYQHPFASGVGTIVPNVINPPVGDFWTMFEYTGTRDYTPFAAMEAALDFREKMGGEECIMGYMHDLAVEAQVRRTSIVFIEIELHT
jgi:selenocysteine lyase/cysteine desulfurase